MNISSAQPTYSITSSDTITIDLSSFTTTSTGSIGTITLNNTGASGTYTIGGTGATGSYSSEYTNTWSAPVEWQDSFPDWNRIQKMCEMYPGLKIAFENFKTTYRLVKDDYDTPPEKRIKS